MSQETDKNTEKSEIDSNGKIWERAKAMAKAAIEIDGPGINSSGDENNLLLRPLSRLGSVARDD